MPYEIYVDGAARGQGATKKKKVGQGACAVMIYRNGKLVAEYTRGLGLVDNNRAEYEAVLLAVIMSWANDAIVDPIIYSDSQMVVNQINGEWECKNYALFPILKSIKDIQSVFRFRVVQVPRNLVSEADALANDYLDDLLSKLES